jgi:hypothetical protein
VRFDYVARFIENPNHGNHVSGCFASRNRLPRSRRRMRTTNFTGDEIRRGGGTLTVANNLWNRARCSRTSSVPP